MLHAATIAIVGEVPLDRLRHAVPCFPTRSEIWLSLLELGRRLNENDANGPLEVPLGRRTVLRMGGGPYTSWPRSLRLTVRVEEELMRRAAARARGRMHVDSAFSGENAIQQLRRCRSRACGAAGPAASKRRRYERFLLDELFPSMREIPGFRGADVLRRARRRRGRVRHPDPLRVARCGPRASPARTTRCRCWSRRRSALLSRHDERAVHYDRSLRTATRQRAQIDANAAA